MNKPVGKAHSLILRGDFTMGLSFWVKRVSLIGLGCVLSLVIIEVGLRLFWPKDLITVGRNIDMVITVDPDIVSGVTDPVHIKTSSEGVRGTEWSNNRSKEFRILTIGGSTTESLMQDQKNTWPALLQTKFPVTRDGRRVWVGNLGHGGFHSRHFVIQMRYMLDQYDPDVVIILMGANDLGLLLSEGMAYDPHFIHNDAKMRNLLLESFFIEKPLSAMIDPGTMSVKSTYLWALGTEIRDRLAQRYIRNVNLHDTNFYSKYRTMRQNAWLIIDDVPDLTLGLEGYNRNVREIIRLAKDHGVHLVLMTEATLYKPDMNPEEIDQMWAGWIGPRDLNAYFSARVLGFVMDAHNKLLLEICAEEKIDCIDLASALPKSTDVFFDHVHFTDYGSSLVADELVEYFESIEN